MKNTVIIGIFTALVVYGLVFTACDNDITPKKDPDQTPTATNSGGNSGGGTQNPSGGGNDSGSQGLTEINLTGTITITAENGLTTGAELTAVYTGTEAIGYQWNKDGNAIPAAVSDKYIAPIAGSYTVTVSAKGYNSKTSDPVMITGDPLPALTGTVSIEYYNGTLEVGQTLRAYTTWLDGNGTISYQWNRGGTPIPGANNSVYIVQSADAGSTITVTVTRSGNSGSVTSNPVGPVPVPLGGTVSIIGTGLVRETLTVDISNLGGDGTISYEWRRNNNNDYYGYISTNSVYVVQPGDIGSTITVTVTRSGYPGSVTSVPVGPVTDPSLSAITGTVSIAGIAEIGQNLWANTGSLGGSGTIYYQWKKGGTAISGANKSAYFVPFADTGSTITVTVTRSGNSGSITSSPVIITAGEAVQPTSGLVFTLKNDGTAYSVSKGTATASQVVIPAFYNELPVTEIPSQGFSGYTNMTSIKIPASVTSIGQSAFYGCSGLTSITIPFVGGGLNESNYYNRGCFGYIFGASSYSNQNSYIPPSLKTVVITGGTSSINEYAFSGCSDLTSITIPSSVTSIGSDAFSGCTGLTSITIPFADYFTYLFGSSVPPSLKTVVITGGTSIGSNAFYGCSDLTSITIPSSVTSIDGGAFYGCTGLTSITIPASVTSIDGRAFSGCSGLTSITIPSSVTSIGWEAFSDCTGLTSVTFQGTHTDIYNYYSLPGDLGDKYRAGGIGTYTRPDGESGEWTKQY